jgi:hypothetical protein
MPFELFISSLQINFDVIWLITYFLLNFFSEPPESNIFIGFRRKILTINLGYLHVDWRH